MTTLYIVATVVLIIAALAFLGSQILIAWRQIDLQIKQNAAFRLRLDEQEVKQEEMLMHIYKIERIAEDAKEKADKSGYEIVKVKEMIHDICNHLHKRNKDNER